MPKGNPMAYFMKKSEEKEDMDKSSKMKNLKAAARKRVGKK